MTHARSPNLDYHQISALANLGERLSRVNGWLVECENSLTAAGDLPEFTELHRQLSEMAQIVVDLETRLSEEGEDPGNLTATRDHTYTASKLVEVWHVTGAANRDAALSAVPGDYLIYGESFDHDANQYRFDLIRTF